MPYARYFVLSYDKAAGIVSVKSLAGAVWADNQSRDEQSPDDVLVEVDKVENLRQAYPNYFGDVRVFLSHLKKAALGYDVSFLQAWGRQAS